MRETAKSLSLVWAREVPLAVLPSFDPTGRMACLLSGAISGESPQQELRRWLSALAPAVDPADAARALLRLSQRMAKPDEGPPAEELLDLLAQVAASPRSLLRSIAAGRRERRLRRLGGEPPWIDIPGTAVKVRGVDWL